MRHTLIYFDGRGRAELARLTMAAGKVDFEDRRLTFEQWGSFKAESLIGSLPMLLVDGKYKLSQSQSVVRFLARGTGLAGRNNMEMGTVDMVLQCVDDIQSAFLDVNSETDAAKKKELVSKFISEKVGNTFGRLNTLASGSGFCVGSALTVADLAIYNFSTYAELDLTPFPKLKAIVNNVAANKGVADWVKKRKPTPF